jgi:F-type H+-transporting ATPase subunit gamma
VLQQGDDRAPLAAVGRVHQRRRALLVPRVGGRATLERIGQQVAEKEAQVKAGALDATRRGDDVRAEAQELHSEVIYDFSPSVQVLLDELLPLTVKTAFFQTFLDATTSEHVARMVAMKSATDNADKMVKALTMQYNRARQSQITTELSEIMGGVEAMKG